MRRLLLPVGLAALAASTFLLVRPTPPVRSASAPAAAPAPIPPAPAPSAVAPTQESLDIRRAARDLRKQARTDPAVLRRLIQILLDAGRPQHERDLAACVLGSLPDRDALLALSQALSRSTDPAWTRLLLLCLGSSKEWGTVDDVFGFQGRPHAVVVPLGLALTVRGAIREDAVRLQMEAFLAEAHLATVREASALSLRHSIESSDVRAAFLAAVRGGSDVELQGLVGGPLADWASHRPVEDVERTDILGQLLRLGAVPEADALRFNVEAGFKQATLTPSEVAGFLSLLERDQFDVKRWTLAILGDQAPHPDLASRPLVRDGVARLLAREADAKMREYAVAGLAGFAGDESIRPALESALRDVAWHVRARAAEALGRWPSRDVRVLEALRRAAGDENAGVRATAEAALRTIEAR